jgi:hypothetical protein
MWHHYIRKKIEVKISEIAELIFIDLEKAYNLVPKNRMWQEYNIDNRLIGIINYMQTTGLIKDKKAGYNSSYAVQKAYSRVADYVRC